MKVLRVDPYPIEIQYTVPTANAMYRMFIQNPINFSNTATELVSTLDKTVSYTLLNAHTNFDADYTIQIFDEDDNLVIEDILSISSPVLSGMRS